MGYICGLGTEMSDLEAKVEFGKFYNNYKMKVNNMGCKSSKKSTSKKTTKRSGCKKK